jgi:hypothetical protein
LAAGFFVGWNKSNVRGCDGRIHHSTTLELLGERVGGRKAISYARVRLW